MEKEIRYFIFLIALLGNVSLGLTQDFSIPPPEPLMTDDETLTSPCGSGDGDGGPGIPPPVGLCLPINDYVLPLFISGISLGVVFLFSLEKQNSKISAP